MTEDDALSRALQAISARFAGVDLQFRRFQDRWPFKWRARIRTNTSVLAHYRLTAYADTAAAAAVSLHVQMCAVDRARKEAGEADAQRAEDLRRRMSGPPDIELAHPGGWFIRGWRK